MKEMTQREMAAMGGHARAATLSKKRLSEIARDAVNTRWRNERKNNKQKGNKHGRNKSKKMGSA